MESFYQYSSNSYCRYLKILLDQHLILDGLPSIEAFLNSPLDLVGGGNAVSTLQDHHLKDDEPLCVPPTRPHPMRYLLSAHTKPPPPYPVRFNAFLEPPQVVSISSATARHPRYPAEVSTIIGIHLVSVDFL